jgi:hypothetical protein
MHDSFSAFGAFLSAGQNIRRACAGQCPCGCQLRGDRAFPTSFDEGAEVPDTMEVAFVRGGNRPAWVVALVVFFCAFQAAAQTEQSEELPFVTVRLPYGIVVEVPRAWRITAGTAKEAVPPTIAGDLDLSGLPLPDNNVLVKAVATPANQPATMSIAFLPQAKLATSQEKELLSGELAAYDQALRQKVDNVCKSQSIALLEWKGTRKEQLNDTLVVVSEYRRQGRENLPVWEQVTAVPTAGGLAVLTVSYSEPAGPPWQAVVLRIHSSLRVNRN